jgi:hypothetical protein
MMMNRILYLITVISSVVILLMLSDTVSAQSKAEIQNVDFYADGPMLVIKYDIVGAKESETFEIWVKITTESGKEIIPSALTGDFGKGVPAGPNKKIEWDVDADEVELSEAFSAEVFARSEADKSLKTNPEKIKSQGRGISVGAAVGLSVILPGLGKTVVKKGGAQWLWGVVGYGCIAGTFILNDMAYNSYEDYKFSLDPDDRDDLFNKAKYFDMGSKICLGAAATIWVVELITTGTQAAKVRNRNKFSLNAGFDPFSGKPLVGFNYRF